MDILLKNATVLDMAGKSRQVDIAVEKNRISSISVAGKTAQAAEKVIDCTEHLAMPGFVNTHTHTAMTLLKSYADDMALMDWLENKIWPVEAKMKSDDIYWGTMLAITEMIKTGTTTFADMYGDMDRVAEAAIDTGIRAVLSRGMIGVAPNGLQALAENKALFDEFHHAADGRITVMFGPHAPYTCPPDFLKKVIAAAQSRQAEIHIHLAETKDEIERCVKEYGKSPFALMEEVELFSCGVLAAHCVHVSPEDMEIMRKYHVRVAHNPGSNMKLASGIAPVTDMLQKGITVGLGTDGSSSNNNLDMLEEMHLAALLHKVDTLNPLALPAAEAIDMATAGGAAVVGLGDAVGALQEGFKADITLWSMRGAAWHPRHDIASLLVYSANSSAVDTVIVDGKILMENSVLKTIDEEKVLFEANRRALALAAR